jgi:hypothetical protein
MILNDPLFEKKLMKSLTNTSDLWTVKKPPVVSKKQESNETEKSQGQYQKT